MSMTWLPKALVCGVCLLWCCVAAAPAAAANSAKDQPLFEIETPVSMAGLVKLANGRLLMTAPDGRSAQSADGGRTWSKPTKLPVSWIKRLAPGLLGGWAGATFMISTDEGGTWHAHGAAQGRNCKEAFFFDTLVVGASGRLYQPAVVPLRADDAFYEEDMARGTLLGRSITIEGHGHWPEMSGAFLYYSDDGGSTWQTSEHQVFIWLDDGYGGIWSCEEPQVVEAAGGRVLMFFRTSLGRIYMTEADPQTPMRFGNPHPLPLAASYSPFRIRRLPGSGDLLLLWNQVSAAETRGGYRRARLCSAISSDDGRTWKHFRTLDQVLLPPAGRLEPQGPPRLVRAARFVGMLPSGFGLVDHPDFMVDDDVVLVTWSRRVKLYSWVRKTLLDKRVGWRLRAVPLSWFYGEDKSPVAEPRDPELVVQLPDGKKAKVPGIWYGKLFWVDSRDLAPLLGVGADQPMRAPVQQVATHLGYKVSMDMTQLYDPVQPRLLVFLAPGRAK